MSDIGIDWGMGKSNRDQKTGIHYGVINQNKVLQVWADSSEAYYGKPEMVDCPECGDHLQTCIPEGANWGDEMTCPNCGETFEIELSEFSEALCYIYNEDGYEAECGDDGDIFITKSPYYTHAQYASPCAPGAGYLMNPIEGGIKTYCFGPDWFDDNKVPYPVYSVATGKEVKP